MSSRVVLVSMSSESARRVRLIVGEEDVMGKVEGYSERAADIQLLGGSGGRK